jgi:hypothetical protein
LNDPCSANTLSNYNTGATSTLIAEVQNNPQYAYWRFEDATTSRNLSEDIRKYWPTRGFSVYANSLNNINQWSTDNCMRGRCVRLHSLEGHSINFGPITPALSAGNQTWSVWHRPTSTINTIILTPNIDIMFIFVC